MIDYKLLKNKLMLFIRTSKKCDLNIMINDFVIEQIEVIKYSRIV